MLDELCALTGWTRRHARRALEEATRTSQRPASPCVRPRIYDADVLEPLKLVWATLNGPCGIRLGPVMGEMVDAMERHGELSVSPEVRAAPGDLGGHH